MKFQSNVTTSVSVAPFPEATKDFLVLAREISSADAVVCAYRTDAFWP